MGRATQPALYTLDAVDYSICFASLNGHRRGECRDGETAKQEQPRMIRAHLSTLGLNSLAGRGEPGATGDWALLGT